jgi:SAM-dependent methyltransferase
MARLYVTTTVLGTIYDYPQYYDLVFGTDTGTECDFLMGCFDLHAKRRVLSVFEPACGSGRLLIKLAQRGFQVFGWDTNRASVDYCNRRFKRYGLPPPAVLGDVVNISLPSKVDAAFNMISSFQLFLTERAAEAHLRSMAANIAEGGLYILGLHLTPSRGQPTQRERHAATRGRISAVCCLWTKQVRVRQRQVHCGMITEVRAPGKHLRIAEDCVFRSYSMQQVRKLLDKLGLFEIVGTYNYHYDIENPISVGPETQDVVYVLRRR